MVRVLINELNPRDFPFRVFLFTKMGKNLNKKHRKDVYEKSNYTCQSCGLIFKIPDNWNGKKAIMDHGIWLEIDHIIPTSKGGNDSIENKQALCQICNNIKSNKF